MLNNRWVVLTVAKKELRNILKQSMSRKEFLGFSVVTVLSLLGVLRVISDLQSRAASLPNAIEPEGGTLAGSAVAITSNTASAGKALKFGPGSGTAWPALPDYPTVKWETLYHAGDTVPQTLARMTTMGTIVILPDGFDGEISNAPITNNILLYFPNIRGFIGAGSGKSRFRIKANTYDTQVTAMRLMDGRNGQNVNAGWHLAGSDQLPVLHAQSNATHPAIESGYILYYGREAVFQDFKTSGFQGDWNSPPGETFQLNLFKDINTKIYGYEADGHNLAGKLVGGSPLGLNNSTDVEVHDSYLHDSYVSGPTGSFAGTWDPDKSTSGWKTFNCRFYRNSNWNMTTLNGYSYGASGKRFSGINHENVYGNVVHDHTNFVTNNPTLFWDAVHISISHHVIDNPDIHIIEPTWDSLHPKMNGAFVVGISDTYGGFPNTQVTPPEVIKNGVKLQPYFHNGNPSTTLPVNPATQFVVQGSDRR